MWITDKFCLDNELWASYIRRTHLKETWKEGDRENTPFSSMDGGRVSFLKVPGVLSGQSTAHERKVPGWWRGGYRPSMGGTHIWSYSYMIILSAREDGRLTYILEMKRECRLWPSIVIFGITEVTLGKQWAAMGESVTKPSMWYSADRQSRDWGMRHRPPSSLSEAI